jgi:hypothetical protein
MNKHDLPRYVSVPGWVGAFRVVGVSVNPDGEVLAGLARLRKGPFWLKQDQPSVYVLVSDLEPSTLTEYRRWAMVGKNLEPQDI